MPGHPSRSCSHDFCLVREETGASQECFYLIVEANRIPGAFLMFPSGSADGGQVCTEGHGVWKAFAAEMSPININPAGAQGFGKTQGADAEAALCRTGMFKLH